MPIAMKVRPLMLTLSLLCLLAPAAGAWAQGYWRDLPPDERRQLRQQMREHWQQEREMRREDGGMRWRDIPPEDRRRMRDEMRDSPAWGAPPDRGQRREWRDAPDGRGGGGRGWRRD